MNSRGSTSLLFSLTIGFMCLTSVAAFRLSTEQANHRLILQLNELEAVNLSETVAWHAWALARDKAPKSDEAVSMPVAIPDSEVQRYISRFGMKTLRAETLGNRFCGYTKYRNFPNEFEMCFDSTDQP